MQKKFEDMILDKLLRKYENSKVSKEGSERNLSIFLLFDEKNMPFYVNEESYKYESIIEDATNYLENLGLIEVFYDSDDKIKKVKLLLENIEQCYKFLEKKSVYENRQDVMRILNKYKNKGNLVSWYIAQIEERIVRYKSTTSFFKTVDDLEEVLYVLEKLEEQKKAISIRNFSVKYLKNSKRLEVILTKVERIVSEYLGLQEEDILSIYNIYKNPSFVYIKGIGKFKIHHQIIDLANLQSELILSDHHVEALHVLSLDCDEVVTVENLTTFYDYPSENKCVVYLGGFHNGIRKKLLGKMYSFNCEISFFHEGDIDAGGFYILNHLIEDTGILFQTRNMNVDTLIRYAKKCLSLTDEDRKRLKKLKSVVTLKKYEEVFDFMLENNVKLEQENISYK